MWRVVQLVGQFGSTAMGRRGQGAEATGGSNVAEAISTNKESSSAGPRGAKGGGGFGAVIELTVVPGGFYTIHVV